MTPSGANGRPKVLLLATQDTKEEEARYLRRHLEDYGCEVIHLDPSVRRTIGSAWGHHPLLLASSEAPASREAFHPVGCTM